jgi:signal transduction histidine kinase
MFRLMRYYSVASFIIIFLAAAILTLFYRQISIRWIEDMASSSSLTLAQTVLNSIKPELVAYLSTGSDGDATDRGITWQELPTEIAAGMLNLTRGTAVGGIKIYDHSGQIFFSTQKGETGASLGDHPGFQSAIGGQVFNFMTYRDTFNRFEGTTAEDNLMHTYIPIRNGPKDPVVGVLEIHTDVNNLIEENDRVLFVTLVGSEFILALLYAVLLIVVRHARNIIENQQKTIQERTGSLEALSERLLKLEEQKKQKIAYDLHEGLAQTLSAIKMNVESSKLQLSSGNSTTQPLESIVPVIQGAISEVRSIATELRPSSLDELGILPTINWFCREFEQQYEDIILQREISVPEATIPASLKIVIYRIIESTLKTIAQQVHTDEIRLGLLEIGGKLQLEISHAPEEPPSTRANTEPKADAEPNFRFAEMKERAALSGGRFTATRSLEGWVTLRASWAATT